MFFADIQNFGPVWQTTNEFWKTEGERECSKRKEGRVTRIIPRNKSMEEVKKTTNKNNPKKTKTDLFSQVWETFIFAFTQQSDWCLYLHIQVWKYAPNLISRVLVNEVSVWKYKLPSYNYLLFILIIFNNVKLLSASSKFFITEVTAKLQILDHNIFQIIGICAVEERWLFATHNFLTRNLGERMTEKDLQITEVCYNLHNTWLIFQSLNNWKGLWCSFSKFQIFFPLLLFKIQLYLHMMSVFDVVSLKKWHPGKNSQQPFSWKVKYFVGLLDFFLVPIGIRTLVLL